jgi:RNA polymerase sigma-54 factor
MALEIKLYQRQQQQLVMTPQLQQAIKLLQLSRVELEEMVSQELQENPTLEESPADELETPPRNPEEELPERIEPVEPIREPTATDKIGTLDWQDYIDTHSNALHGSLTAESGGDEDEGPLSWENRLTKKTSLEDHLIWQLRLSRLSEAEEKIGLYIIGNLAENGYLAISLDDVCQATDGALETAEAVLKKIHFFDPPGVAARDLRECLLVQLQNLGLADSLAARMVSEHLAQLENRRFEKLARELGITVDEIVAASQVITALEPRPSRGFDEEETRTIIPDVSVKKIEGEWVIFLNDDGLPRLRVNSFYRRLAGQQGAEEEKARQYLQEKVRAAQWLIKSINQRQQTLYRVTECIFKFQREFLDHGVSQLKPMVLRDVADSLVPPMHESTVSRATTNKYVDTPQGLFELKYFFQSSLRSGNGEDVSSESVKNKIRGIISTEDPKKPLSDQHIAKLLTDDAIGIARRTVAKYREAMGILPSSRRRQPYLRK